MITEAQPSVEEAVSTFKVAGARLYRRSYVPGNPVARVLLVPGYGDHSGRYRHFLQWLAQRGIAAHSYDPYGHGLSSGIRGSVRRHWDEFLDELDACLDQEWLQGESPLFVVGHSHGGLIAAGAAVRPQGLGAAARGLVLSSPFLRSKVEVPPAKLLFARTILPVLPSLRLPSGLKHEWMTTDPGMGRESRRDPLIFRTATPRWYLGALAAQERVLREGERVALPLLVLLPQHERIADNAAAEALCAAAASPQKHLREYPDTRHELLREAIREEVFQDIYRFIQEHCDQPGATN